MLEKGKFEAPGQGPYTYMAGRGFIPWDQEERERRALMNCANVTGFCMLFYLLLRTWVPAYLVRLFLTLLPDLRYFNSRLVAPDWIVDTISNLSFVVCMLVPAAVYLVLVRVPVRVAVPLRRPDPLVTLAAVLIAMGVSVVGAAASNTFCNLVQRLGMVPVLSGVAIPVTAQEWAVSLFGVCLLPAVLEELIYRGVLMQSFRRFGDSLALLLSSAIFSALHLNVSQIPITFLMGLVIGYFVLRTGSLWTGIIIHFCNNALALVQQAVMNQLDFYTEQVLDRAAAISYLMLALAALVFLSQWKRDLFAINPPPPSRMNLARKMRLFFSSPSMVIVSVLILCIMLNSVQMF